MNTDILTRVLRTDAAANALGGTVLVATAGWLADPMGLASAWPLRIVGAFLVIYGLENLLVARRTTTAGLTALVVGDLLFAVAVLTVAIADPTSAETWVRWVLVAVADIAGAVGVAKLVALRRLSVRRRAQAAIRTARS